LPPGSQEAARNALNVVVATAGGAAAGALAGGSQGALAGAGSASNNEIYNRQLHPEEKTLAQQIAQKSGGKYTTAQVEDQMRIMGATVNGAVESGAAATLIGQAPSDAGAGWLPAGQTADGKPILTQTTAAVDPQLQAYIVNNYASAAPGAVPSVVSGYTASPTQAQTGAQYGLTESSGSVCPRGDCGVAVTGLSRDQVANVAGMASAQLGVASATAAAVASYNGGQPYISGPAATISIATGTASFVFAGIQQALAPNLGQYSIEGVGIGLATYVLGNRYPLAGPIITQAGNTIPQLPAVTNLESQVNARWDEFVRAVTKGK